MLFYKIRYFWDLQIIFGEILMKKLVYTFQPAPLDKAQTEFKGAFGSGFGFCLALFLGQNLSRHGSSCPEWVQTGFKHSQSGSISP